jgi:outer membrane biogenesis lipoprotein LolB
MTVQRERLERATGILLGMAAVVLLAACSSKEPKPMAQPTPDQVRGHADQGFDKLKQEERERGGQPATPR